jgi:hypothetical protein
MTGERFALESQPTPRRDYLTLGISIPSSVARAGFFFGRRAGGRALFTTPPICHFIICRWRSIKSKSAGGDRV